MSDEVTDFIDALAAYVAAQLAASPGAADYDVGRVHVADARNHLFRPGGPGRNRRGR